MKKITELIDYVVRRLFFFLIFLLLLQGVVVMCDRGP